MQSSGLHQKDIAKIMGHKHQNKMIRKLDKIKRQYNLVSCLSAKNLASTQQILEELTQTQFIVKTKQHLIWKQLEYCLVLYTKSICCFFENNHITISKAMLAHYVVTLQMAVAINILFNIQQSQYYFLQIMKKLIADSILIN